MEILLEDGNSSSPNLEYKGVHQAFKDRWKETDDTMCRHSMSFHLHHTVRSDFFASYLYLLETIPLVKLFPVTCEYIQGVKQFYYRAQQFYEGVPASEEGMMGDFVEISNVDLEASRQFLKRFVLLVNPQPPDAKLRAQSRKGSQVPWPRSLPGCQLSPWKPQEVATLSRAEQHISLLEAKGPGKAGNHCALDCGSGIGRVTKGVLLPVFEKMEMADMMEHFLLHAHEDYLGDDADRIETYYCYKLQEFTPPKSKYDIIWMQWVACHLTDKDLMNFLIRCKRSLSLNGVIIVKDNMARQGCMLDPIDSSISRHLDIMKSIIYKAGLEILSVERQEGFPDVMMPVWMIAMK
ncbi:N-terminal Xaa-Pro-Lys N-methyltransferase 2 isoform X1 [Syngnathoides biaculeatus]|uniref:N-terminal Xaa-Pro-Lys N-methyltransferase 2 isoform X1 n=1 Tax=Syngnathoides biaculeatus TaxID=300417 RepID=UPI002ADE54D6|nr:N-terminal Xaa-Pro-Lys N-methyltransferase 2 isoform X1 [Syngnathoides biaculeatus]XP_061682164.1 N-terminal Xaa-Pro-Lys N-methyltransferase 2 isoform X1 [Syngnathoides biaculeatus]